MASNKPNKFMKRIEADVNEAAAEPGFKIAFIEPDKYDRFYVQMVVEGGKYEGITIVFELAMNEYPLKAPHFKVLTPSMWHPNVSALGTVCVDFLYDPTKWSAAYTIVSMFRAFQLLLEDANVDGGHHNPEASALWRDCIKNGNNFAPYMEMVKKKTGKYSKEYEQYFKLGSDHCIIPRAKVVTKTSTDEEKKAKVSAMAGKFAKLSLKNVKSKKEIPVEDESSDSDSNAPAPLPTPPVKKASVVKSAKFSTSKKKQSTNDSEDESPVNTKTKPQSKHAAKKEESSDEDSDSDNNNDSDEEEEEATVKSKSKSKSKQKSKTESRSKKEPKAKTKSKAKSKSQQNSDSESESSD